MKLTKSLKEIFDRPKNEWNTGDVSFLVYRNRFNEVKPYQVIIVFDEGSKLTVYDIEQSKMKTFKEVNVLSKCGSYEEAAEFASKEQKKFTKIPRTKTEVKWANREKLLEACFTGFPKVEKEELVQLAKENDIFIRTSVTKNLGILVCGKTAGWSKLEKAKELGIAIVYGSDGFRNFIETGEIDE